MNDDLHALLPNMGDTFLPTTGADVLGRSTGES